MTDTVIKYKKLRENGVAPRYATAFSAGADLYCASEGDIVIPAGERRAVPTGIAVECDRRDVALLIYARSGLATKHGVSLANGVGVVDSDYRGEIIVSLINNSDREYTVAPGERIAQLVVTPVLRAEYTEADELSDTERGEGGFGSTGVR